MKEVPFYKFISCRCSSVKTIQATNLFISLNFLCSQYFNIYDPLLSYDIKIVNAFDQKLYIIKAKGGGKTNACWKQVISPLSCIST